MGSKSASGYHLPHHEKLRGSPAFRQTRGKRAKGCKRTQAKVKIYCSRSLAESGKDPPMSQGFISNRLVYLLALWPQ
jgi:hypothetical protein